MAIFWHYKAKNISREVNCKGRSVPERGLFLDMEEGF